MFSNSWTAVSRIILVFLCVLWPLAGDAADRPAPSIRILEIAVDAVLSPAQADLLDDALAKAGDGGYTALLVRLDTPGGSVDVMRRMVTAILNAKVPVLVWVAPSGARAASAGVFLMAAATVSAMAPQTTIGSATPVGPSGADIQGALKNKVQNDLVSLVRGMAETRGRNAGWYASSVTRAANLTAFEAVRERVVDCVAVDREDLLSQIGRRGLPVRGEVLHFAPAEVALETHAPGLWYDALSWLLNPQIAYILLLAGMAGLFFELITPGAVLPGVIGALSLLLALYALSVLPTNAAGLLLLVLGGVFFVLEVHVTSYGLLGLSGVIALFVGSLLLFRFEGGSGLPLSVVLPTVLGVSVLLGLALALVTRAQALRPQSGLAALVGRRAVVRQWNRTSGKVFVRGELWEAVSSEDLALAPGEEVVILATGDMRLVVGRPAGHCAAS